MVNVFEQDFKIVPKQDLDYLEIDRIKKIESENKYLTYGLIAGGIVLIGVITLMLYDQDKQQRKNRETNL